MQLDLKTQRQHQMFQKGDELLNSDKEKLKKEASRYLEIFRDHPYIFNLGHGILPETNPEMVENLIKIVKDFK